METQETAATESTQALLDKLKHALPWNQPQIVPVAKTTEVIPPNVVAPSFATAQIKQRVFNQQLVS